jgi:hypothetical protein
MKMPVRRKCGILYGCVLDDQQENLAMVTRELFGTLI